MKNKWYKAEIIERFMDRETQQWFEENYYKNKIVVIGRKVVKEKYEKTS